jgi:hypothetical protein
LVLVNGFVFASPTMQMAWKTNGWLRKETKTDKGREGVEGAFVRG